VLVGNSITNFSRLAREQGSVISTVLTIGYDAPWRQVHQLLLRAASRTEGIRAQPAAHVEQRALSDFYVEYELRMHIDRSVERVPILSALHAEIQDAFNEAGVQIMSPHFENQPDGKVWVPRSASWPPARGA
jgi:small-conductance mechanosensitive channel